VVVGAAGVRAASRAAEKVSGIGAGREDSHEKTTSASFPEPYRCDWTVRADVEARSRGASNRQQELALSDRPDAGAEPGGRQELHTGAAATLACLSMWQALPACALGIDAANRSTVRTPLRARLFLAMSLRFIAILYPISCRMLRNGGMRKGLSAGLLKHRPRPKLSSAIPSTHLMVQTPRV